MTVTTADVLPRAVLLRLIGLLVLVLAPHALRVPVWESALVAVAIGWRLAHLQRGVPLPGRVIKTLLTIAAFAGVYVTYGRVNGQHPGTALLVLMAALKLLEMRSQRDVRVMVALLYFLVFTHFLFSQEIWTVAWLLVTVVGVTGLLVEVNTRAATGDGAGRQFALAVGRADDDEEVVGIEILDGELAHVVDRRIVLGSQDIGDGVGHELSVAGLGAVEDDDGHDLLP